MEAPRTRTSTRLLAGTSSSTLARETCGVWPVSLTSALLPTQLTRCRSSVAWSTSKVMNVGSLAQQRGHSRDQRVSCTTGGTGSYIGRQAPAMLWSPITALLLVGYLGNWLAFLTVTNDHRPQFPCSSQRHRILPMGPAEVPASSSAPRLVGCR